MHFFIGLLVIFLSIAASAERILTLKGSNTIGEDLAPSLAKAYLEKKGLQQITMNQSSTHHTAIITGIVNPFSSTPTKMEIAIEAHGSSTGFKALINNQTDIVMSSRRIKDKEVIALSQLGDMKKTSTEQTIGIDGLSIVTHPDKPIHRLTLNQIRQIFAGQVTHWDAVGGLKRPITLYARDAQSGTWDTFKKMVLGQSLTLADHAERFESNTVLAEQVMHDLNAIGFVGLAAIGETNVLAIGEEGIDALKPGKFEVATEDYPLARRLYLYVPENTDNPIAKEFIEFSQSAEGQEIVGAVGFVSQNIQKASIDKQSKMPVYYQELTDSAERLSINFRFAEGSPSLDTKASRDIQRLVQYLIDKKKLTGKIYLVGFSNATKSYSEDVVLSRFRALAVRRELLKQGVIIADSRGLGSFMPVASETNTFKNDRVEVWIDKNEEG
ncbi:MAG: substrate-binding domain-containing protein [Cellvibrionales bacterium]|nr:substrate-binding domain-containing protein [Cellvibrionales bacterium]